VRISDFPRVIANDAIETGHHLNHMLNDHESDELVRYMVELKYWDFLGLQLTAGHYEAVIYDREYDLFNRNTTSIFSEETKNICARLSQQNVKYVTLSDPQLKTNAQMIDCLKNEMQIGTWIVYELTAQP
jgi:hypothetical protein